MCHLACGILFPRSGIEPKFPALKGGDLTTGPPGKSLLSFSDEENLEKGRGAEQLESGVEFKT